MEAPPECSERELDKRLGGIRWRLECASSGELRDQEKEVPPLVERIRVTTGWLVWGEQHDVASFVEVFRKHTMFEAFAFALRADACPKAVKVQVMQSIAQICIVMPKMKHGPSIDYLLSVLNPFFEIPPDLDDEEMLGYFVSLLKSLALRLDEQNVKHCLTPSEGSPCSRDSRLQFSMPALNCAVSLVTHEESMVRTAAQTAVLKIAQMQNADVCDVVDDVITHLLAPRLAKVALAIGESHTPLTYTCAWMYNDPSTAQVLPGVAHYNPLRWSSLKNTVQIIEDLRQCEQPHRPIMLNFYPGKTYYECRSVTEAIAVVEKIVQQGAPVSAECLTDFIEELFRLNIPGITAALQAQGFKADVTAWRVPSKRI